MDSRLTPLQLRVLRVAAPIEPRWTLTGGAALAGFHLGHRDTRDLDLFWNGQTALDELDRRVAERLRADGLEVVVVQRFGGFAELLVTGDGERLKVDLVADPTARVENPTRYEVEGHDVWVDTPREILANKLCALLSRAEMRDLVDVRALLASGGSLEVAMEDAPRKDGGFSAAVLAWVLQTVDFQAMARAVGMSADDAADLSAWRQTFIDRLVSASAPTR